MTLQLISVLMVPQMTAPPPGTPISGRELSLMVQLVSVVVPYSGHAAAAAAAGSLPLTVQLVSVVVSWP